MFGLLHASKYDAVLLDAEMPIRNPIELYRTVRELRPDTAVLLWSVHNSAVGAGPGLKVGACDFAMKACHITEIVDRVRLAIRAGHPSEA